VFELLPLSRNSVSSSWQLIEYVKCCTGCDWVWHSAGAGCFTASALLALQSLGLAVVDRQQFMLQASRQQWFSSGVLEAQVSSTVGCERKPNDNNRLLTLVL
jgi:hypothetical protein